MPETIASRIVWNYVGGSVAEVKMLLEVAASIGLIEMTPDGIGRLPKGTRARDRLRSGDQGIIGMHVLRSGAMADQARLLVESAVLDPSVDCFRCPAEVRRDAAQLVAILRLQDEIPPTGDLVLTRVTYERIGAVWVFMDSTEHLPPWLQERQAIGYLAELYCWNRERLCSADPSKVSWVSRDSDRFGYDIENRNTSPTRCIEVKGSRGVRIQFLMSPNEMDKARLLADRYEIHFWGHLSLTVDVQQQYENLSVAGYPVIIVNPITQFSLGGWSVEPDGWRVAREDDTDIQ
jgi:hypothetical protein